MKKRLVVVMSKVGRDGSVYKRTAPGILMVMKMFYILTPPGQYPVAIAYKFTGYW